MDTHIHPGHAFGWPESPDATGFALLFIIVMALVKDLYSSALITTGAAAIFNVLIRTGKTAV